MRICKHHPHRLSTADMSKRISYCIAAFCITITIAFPLAEGRVRQHTLDEAYYPRSAVIKSFEARNMWTSIDFNRLAGAFALHGDLILAQRALRASLHMDSRQADAYYLLGSIFCRMHQLGKARDIFSRAYRIRELRNSFEASQVNTDTCSIMPLLLPADAVMHDQAYPLFPFCVHHERLYVLRPLSSGSEEDKAIERSRGIGLGGGEWLIKQLSGNAAMREAAALAILGSVRKGEFARHFPRVYMDDGLDRVSKVEGRGIWTAYAVEHVRTVAATTHISTLSREGNIVEIAKFIQDTLQILEALQEAGIVHNNLDAEQLLIGVQGHAVLVDAEIAAGATLPAPSSASMMHKRELHEHGMPNDAVSLGRSLEKLLHRHHVTRFDCVIQLLVTANDPTYPHVIQATHPVHGGAHTYVNHSQVAHALKAASVVEGALQHTSTNGDDGAITHSLHVVGNETMPETKGQEGVEQVAAKCKIGRHGGWSAYHEDRPEDEAFAGDIAGLGVEPAGAPAFEHNMALYELDSLVLAGSGLPAQRLADFFYGLGGDLTALQQDARMHYNEAMRGTLAFTAPAAAGEFVASSALCCWDTHASGIQLARNLIRNATLCWNGEVDACTQALVPTVPSIDALAHGYSLQELLVLHKAWADWFYSRIPPVHWRPIRNAPLAHTRRLTVVYASSHTFMNHGSHLTLLSVFEAHDDQRLHVVHLLMVAEQDIEKAGSLPTRQEFINIAHISDAAAAQKINVLGAHILVDLNGYLSNTRLTIAAMNPTPICIHHFAQPSTMGAHYIQQFIADAVIVPPEHAPMYSEALSYIPRIFISTSARHFSPEAISFPPQSPHPRAGLDLPMAGALLCSFNAFYKVQPSQFDVWARVMLQRPHLVLVLRAKYGATADCVVKQVLAAGLHEDRVHFTGELSGDAHSRRCAACDIVVDTDNFNGITTTATVLWAGTPVVTHATENNAGRCAAAMLLAMGAAELVARDREDYEKLLLRLSAPSGREFLTQAREKLADQRMRTPLFAPRHMASSYERVFSLAWDVLMETGGKAGTHHTVLTDFSIEYV